MKQFLTTIFLMVMVMVMVISLQAKEDDINLKFNQLMNVADKVLLQEKSKDSKEQSCDRQAIVFEKEQKKVLEEVEESFLTKNSSGFSHLFANSFSVHGFTQRLNPVVTKLNANLDLYSYSDFSLVSTKNALNKDIEEYFSKFQTIKKFETNVVEISPTKDGESTELLVSFATKGVNETGLLLQDSGTLKLTLVKKQQKWLISNLRFVDFKSLINKERPHFKLASAVTPKTYLRSEAIRRGGYAIAVGDYDGDKNQDILVGAYGPMEIYKGDGKGNFKKDISTGIPEYTLVKAAAWADFDNDGDQDLALIRFIEHDPTKSDHTTPNFKFFAWNTSQVLIFKNNGLGKFSAVPQFLNDGDMVLERAMPLAVGDFNRDGLLDLYVGYPGVNDFTTLVSADNKNKYGHKVQGVYLNVGSLIFKSKSMAKTQDVIGLFGSGNVLYPHSAMALDLDANGSSDIVVMDDRGNLSPIYKNDGNANFSKYKDNLNVNIRAWAMGMAAGDINNDGKLDMAITAVTYNAIYQYEKCMKTEPIEKGLSLFVKSSKNESFNELKTKDFDFPGEGLAGAEFIDYDQDGRQDLYVTNGLWSGTDKRAQDISGPAVRALRSSHEEPTFLEEDLNQTKSFVMDLLTRYKNTDGKYLSMAGFQSNRLYKNIGNNQFIDVAYVEGVDSSYDGYVVAKADFNNDGVQDLILRNADPGVRSVVNPPVQVFYGEKTNNNGLMLNLISMGANRDSIGAEVKVKVDNMPLQVQQLIANNGCAQSQKTLFFTLGSHNKAEQVEIRWPGGKIESFHNLKAGIHDLTEGGSKKTIINEAVSLNK